MNALIHRDYTIAGGAVSLAIFDDRVEVWSAGRYPAGITPELLSRSHPSVQRNPVIADVFHRAGLIEKWGRGTNRVGEMCRAGGIAPPEFAEIGGAAVATFRVSVAPSRGKSGAGAESGAESRAESRAESLDARVLAALGGSELSKAEIAERLHLRTVSGQLNRTIRSLVGRGHLELDLPQVGFGKALLDSKHLHSHHPAARVEVEVGHDAQDPPFALGAEVKPRQAGKCRMEGRFPFRGPSWGATRRFA